MRGLIACAILLPILNRIIELQAFSRLRAQALGAQQPSSAQLPPLRSVQPVPREAGCRLHTQISPMGRGSGRPLTLQPVGKEISEDLKDVYSRITNKIIADLEQGVRPWFKPWNAGNTEGWITRPLRYNGVPYNGINIVMLWSAATGKGYSNSHWLSFKQTIELGGNVRKGEKGELVVYANRITRTETDEKGGEIEREIPFMKGYTVFNADQCDGLPKQFRTLSAAPTGAPFERIGRAEHFFPQPVPTSVTAGRALTMP